MLTKTVSLCLILLIIISSGLSIPAITTKDTLSRNTTLYVGGSGPGNYSTIKAAIAAAAAGDTIFVYPGTYRETNLYINTTLTIRGADAATTIIDGMNSYQDILIIYADNTTITNVTLRRSNRHAVSIIASSVTFSHCYIKDNTAGWTVVLWSSDNQFHNTFFDNCTFSNNDHWDIYFQGGNHNYIRSCMFNTGHILVHYPYGPGLTITDCIFTDIANDALQLWGVSDLLVRDCHFIHGLDAITLLDDGSNNRIEDCIFDNIRLGIKTDDIQNDLVIRDCCFSNASYASIELGSGSGVTIVNNTFNEGIGICICGRMMNSVISHCRFINLTPAAIYLSYPLNYWNHFTDNTFIGNDIDIWCSPVYFGFGLDFSWFSGNYWDRYRWKDRDGDGFGDIPYHVYGLFNWDFHPRMTP